MISVNFVASELRPDISRSARRQSWGDYIERINVHTPTQELFKMIKKI